MVPLAWESSSTPQRTQWSQHLQKIILEDWNSLLPGANDMTDFCPRYNSLDNNERANVWAQLFVGMAKYESAYSPTSRMQETTMGSDPVTGKPVYSEGLLQLSYQDTQWASWCKFDWSKDKILSSTSPQRTILDPYLNLDCGVGEATRKHIWLAAKHHKPIVIGKTGLTADDMKEMQDAAKECPLLFSANMSVGINLLAALVGQASKRLGHDFDIEISEIHHRNKVDAPSGTALMLGKATGRTAAPMDRSGKRETGTLGYAVQRGGDVIGEHIVTFFDIGERIELGHCAHDRSLLAKGALRAASWLQGKPHGFYTMRDVLDL